MLCDLGKVECKLIQRVRQHIKAESNCEVKTLLQFVTVLEEFKIIFHKLHKLSVIAGMIPASPASWECTFSCLRKAKDISSEQDGE